MRDFVAGEGDGGIGEELSAQHVCQGMVLLEDFDRGGVRQLRVFRYLDAAGARRQAGSYGALQGTYAFSPSSRTKSSYRLGAFISAR